MTNKQCETLARYIVAFIEYELTEHGRTFDPSMIEQAIQAYKGGAR